MASTWHGPLALLLLVWPASPTRAALDLPRATPTTSSVASPAPVPLGLLVRVVDSVTRLRLPNAEVTAGGLRRLTDAHGNARFTWPDDGTLSIRVRQLGFRYAERTVRRGASATAVEDTVVIALGRAAYALPQAVTVADRRCTESADSASLALSAWSMELLRFGAEQFNSFRETYPFTVNLVRRTLTRGEPGRPRRPPVEDVAQRIGPEHYGGTYHPDHVLQKTGSGYFVPLLFVSTLADSAFWARHCFVARGVETHEGRRVIRLDFHPAPDVRTVDWSGSAWLDSAASVLRRVDFRLANVRDPNAPRRFEGYTTFAVPSPFIAVPDSTLAWWWRRRYPRASEDEHDAEVVQSVTMRDAVYVRGTPPLRW